MGDALLAADTVEQHLGRVRTEPTGEHLAVVSEDLVGDPVALQGGPEHPADRSGVGPLHQPGGHTEPGMVVDAGHGLELAAIGQPDPTHDVQLP